MSLINLKDRLAYSIRDIGAFLTLFPLIMVLGILMDLSICIFDIPLGRALVMAVIWMAIMTAPMLYDLSKR